MATWTFTQLYGPPNDRKTLELDGWYAPFGRPRREPVIKEVIKSRTQLTRYPGSNAQTRHAFGTNWETTEIQGRWMTKAGGKTAVEMADEWTLFMKDERTCRIAWGLIVSYIGYIEELELGRESEHDIAWKMKIQIDERDDISTTTAQPPTLRPENDMSDVMQWLALSAALKEPNVPNMSPGFLESLDNLAAELNKPSAAFAKLVGQIDDLEKNTFSTIQHLRGAVTGFRTSLANLQETLQNVTVDTALLVRDANSDMAWVKYQLDVDFMADVMKEKLDDISDILDDILSSFGTQTVIGAREGDSWESLAIRSGGNARTIRDLAGAKFGEKPVPGESYLTQPKAIPQARLRTLDRIRSSFKQ